MALASKDPAPGATEPTGPEQPTCLNCGKVLHGPFCSFCTQRHALPEDLGIRGMMSEGPRVIWEHLLVLRDTPRLVFQPGFLLREYLAGRRVRHVHPWTLWATWWAVSLTITGVFTETDRAWLEEMLSPEVVAAASETQLTVLMALSRATALVGKGAEGLMVVAILPVFFRVLLGTDERGMLPYWVLALHLAAFDALVGLPIVPLLEALEQVSTGLLLGGAGVLGVAWLVAEGVYVALSVRIGLERSWGRSILAGAAFVAFVVVLGGLMALLGGLLLVLMETVLWLVV